MFLKFPPVEVELNGKFIISKKAINVLGVIFGSKLQWTEQVANASSNALKAIGAIKLIKRFFNKKEILQLITSNVYSVLYYNSKIWHISSLKNNLKQKLLSVSAKALKISMYFPDPSTDLVFKYSCNEPKSHTRIDATV